MKSKWGIKTNETLNGQEFVPKPTLCDIDLHFQYFFLECPIIVIKFLYPPIIVFYTDTIQI